MANYIDRDLLLKDIEESVVYTVSIGQRKFPEIKGANKVIDRIRNAPTADVVEVKHGKWNINCDGYYPYCSECGYEPERPCFHKDNRTPYCPNCGAKMHLEVESTTYCTDKKNHLCHCEDCHEEC